MIIWSVWDVLEQAKQRRKRLTRKQAEETMDAIGRRHDATIGVTWDTLNAYINGDIG